MLWKLLIWMRVVSSEHEKGGNCLGPLDEHCWLSPTQDQDPAGLMGTWIKTRQVNPALFRAYFTTLIDRYFRIALTMHEM